MNLKDQLSAAFNAVPKKFKEGEKDIEKVVD